jgi:hypothetical protein
VRQWSLRKVPRRWRGLNMKRRLQWHRWGLRIYVRCFVVCDHV